MARPGAGMTGGDGYLSHDRQHLARQQRERRARMVRMDYMPNRDALAIIAAKRATLRPGSVAATNSAVLDAIVMEWAAMTGINWSDLSKPMTSVKAPEFCDHYTRAYDSERVPGISPRIAPACVRANNPERMVATANQKRVICGAKRRRDGEPCQSKSVPGKRRCKWHGGCSTGPKTPEGRAKALANLKRGSAVS